MHPSRSILSKLGVSVVTTCLLLLLGEVALRGYFHFHQSYLVEMWRYGRHHKRFVADARSHEHVPGTGSVIMGKPVRIDRMGYRGPDREPDPRARRILVLGDSVTFGFGVAVEEAYPAVLERSVPGTQVWNAGVGNYNTEQELATLPDHLAQIHPSEVILGFFANDLEPVQRGSSSSIVQASLLLSLSSQLWWRYSDPLQGNYLDYYQHWFDVGWTSWAAAADSGIRLLAGRNVPLKVLLIPEFHALKTGKFSVSYKRVADFFRSRNVPVCDAETFFPPTTTGGTEYWAAPDDSHPNALAHRILARALVATFYGSR